MYASSMLQCRSFQVVMKALFEKVQSSLYNDNKRTKYILWIFSLVKPDWDLIAPCRQHYSELDNSKQGSPSHLWFHQRWKSSLDNTQKWKKKKKNC